MHQVETKKQSKCKMHLWAKLKEKLKGNIFLQALPFAFLIAALTGLGLFGGFMLGNRFESSIPSFALAFVLSFLGFFLGLLISYAFMKLKY
jgi:hypothetical protein